MLSEKRVMEAAQAFFQEAIVVVGPLPERVTTDGLCQAFDEVGAVVSGFSKSRRVRTPATISDRAVG